MAKPRDPAHKTGCRGSIQFMNTLGENKLKTMDFMCGWLNTLLGKNTKNMGVLDLKITAIDAACAILFLHNFQYYTTVLYNVYLSTVRPTIFKENLFCNVVMRIIMFSLVPAHL